MRVLPAANVVSFTPRRSSYAAENDRRELSRQWIGRLRADIKAGNLDVAAADKKGGPVKLSSVLALAKSLASPRYPSFWHGGIYARQSAIGADPDVGLGDRQVARVINLLVKAGYLERADQDGRKGRTCLLKPKTPDAKMSEPSDTMSDTPDKMSEESSDLKPANQKADSPLPPVEPRSEAVSGQARRSLSTTQQVLNEGPVQEALKGEIMQLDAFCDDQWHRFRNAYPWPPGHGTRRAHKLFLAHTVDHQEALISRAAALDRKSIAQWPANWIADQEFNPDDSDDAGKEADRDRGADEDLPGEGWCQHLRRHLGNDVFRAWFAQVRTLRLENGVATMAVRSRFIKSRIDREYAEQLLAAWRAHDATVTSIELVVGT
jgi:DnaA N-terminal domain